MKPQNFFGFPYESEGDLHEIDFPQDNINKSYYYPAFDPPHHYDFEFKGSFLTDQIPFQTSNEMRSSYFPFEEEKSEKNLLISDNEGANRDYFTEFSHFHSLTNFSNESFDESTIVLPNIKKVPGNQTEIQVNSIKKRKEPDASIENVRIKSQKNEANHYLDRNFPKILGLRCLNLVIDGVYEKGTNKLFSWLHDKYEKILKKRNISGKTPRNLLDEFKKWAKSQKKNYRKLQTFREFWSKDAEENASIGCEELVFRKVLKKITKKFLKKDCYRWLFSRKSGIEEKNLGIYMKLIPKFLRGIHDPKHLFMSKK